MTFFIITAVKTSNLTFDRRLHSPQSQCCMEKESFALPGIKPSPSVVQAVV
jgi:hypothetical protein